jgi:hypothetical protein
MVPEKFFEEERKALTKAAKNWRVFLRRWVERRPIGSGDPIDQVERSQRERVIRSPSTSTLAAAFEERSAFAAREAPELWEAVLAEP